MNRICLIFSGVGQILVDLEKHTLEPADLLISSRLWLMIHLEPRKAAQRMSFCEKVASEYAEDSNSWFWSLPVPSEYSPCPIHMC